ncbi:MAG: hypothetical protein EAZ57_00175 [Cytophagales bacterium]|nr:MAG: hypothetical protein EAZ67_13095 [Cytophagales bacterium]TAF62517.1 MAG: hypothetical protein EAZ57_00175 [Cytophagales bacterium]
MTNSKLISFLIFGLWITNALVSSAQSAEDSLHELLCGRIYKKTGYRPIYYSAEDTVYVVVHKFHVFTDTIAANLRFKEKIKRLVKFDVSGSYQLADTGNYARIKGNEYYPQEPLVYKYCDCGGIITKYCNCGDIITRYSPIKQEKLKYRYNRKYKFEYSTPFPKLHSFYDYWAEGKEHRVHCIEEIVYYDKDVFVTAEVKFGKDGQIESYTFFYYSDDKIPFGQSKFEKEYKGYHMKLFIEQFFRKKNLSFEFYTE